MAFGSHGIITQHSNKDNLHTYFVGFDLGNFRYDPFCEILMDTIVDFAFGYHTGILRQYDRRKLKEAAKSIYGIREYAEVKWVYVDKDDELCDCEIKAEQKYLKRGEFGELILHLLLRDFIKTTPLLSKIHFKDTDGETVHGFDLVHIGQDLKDASRDSLFLGESKLYFRKDGTAGRHGVHDLVEDVVAHFKLDFLEREIAIINKKRDAFIPLEVYSDLNTRQDYEAFLTKKGMWFEKLKRVEEKKLKLQDFLSSVTVPLVCTYQSEICSKHSDETDPNFLTELDEEVDVLRKEFEDRLTAASEKLGSIKTHLNLLLILFPIPSKKELIKKLHSKLYHQQNA